MPDHTPGRDYSRSRAVVMGTWDYAHLPPVPAAENSLRRMVGLLTGPWCGWPAARVTVLGNEPGPGDLPDRLVSLFADVSQVAVFYYVGHGQVDDEDQLCLGLVGSRPEPTRRATTGLPFAAVRRALSISPAATKVVILDCCFSGLATRRDHALAGDDFLDLAAGTGAYTMAASSPYATAWFETDIPGPLTYFTKYLADVVEAGIPGEAAWLSLHEVFTRLRANLARDGRPVPQARNIDEARDFPFARNAAPPDTHVGPGPGSSARISRTVGPSRVGDLVNEAWEAYSQGDHRASAACVERAAEHFGSPEATRSPGNGEARLVRGQVVHLSLCLNLQVDWIQRLREWAASFPADPWVRFALIRAELDSLGLQEANLSLTEAEACSVLDSQSVAWVRKLIELAASGRVGSRPATPPARRLSPGGPLACREDSMEVLTGFLRGVRAGAGGMALVAGPGGIGKTRLLVETLQGSPTSETMLWITLSTDDVGYRAWRRLLRPLWEYVRLTELAPIALLSQQDTLDELLLERLDASSRPEISSKEVADAVAGLLGYVSRRKPVIVVLDNAHHGGLEFDQLLLDVARRLVGAPAGIVASLRDDELRRRSPLAVRLGGRDGGEETRALVRLPPLDLSGIRQVREARGDTGLTAEVLKHVQEQTDGIPQLVEDVELGAPPFEASSIGRLAADKLGPLEASFATRTSDARRVLLAGAVTAVQRRIFPGLVARLLGVAEVRVISVLRDEVNSGRIVVFNRGWYKFRHDNWVEAVKEGSDPRRLREMHHLVLTASPGELGVDSRRQARHAVAAGVDLVGIPDFVRLTGEGARLAAADFALDEAIELYDEAIAVASPRAKARLLISQADSLRFQGLWEDATERLRHASDIARGLGSADLEADAIIPLHRLSWRVDLRHHELTERIRLLVSALPINAPQHAQLQALLAARLTWDLVSHQDERVTLAEEALSYIPQTSDVSIRAEILTNSRLGLQDYLDPAQLLRLSRETYAIGVRSRNIHYQGEGLVCQIVDLLRLGSPSHLDLAEQTGRLHKEFAERTGASLPNYVQATMNAMFALANGNFDESERWTNAAAEIGGAWGGPAVAELVMGQTGWCRYEKGDVEALGQMIDEIVGAELVPGNTVYWRIARAIIHAECDDPASAAAILRSTGAETARLRRLVHGPIRIGTLALAAISLGHPVVEGFLTAAERSELGGALVDELDAHKDQGVLLGWPAVFLGDKQHFIGLALLAAGDTPEAKKAFEHAVNFNSRFAALSTRSRFALARTLYRQHGKQGDASKLMQGVLSDATRLGMKKLSREAARQIKVEE